MHDTRSPSTRAVGRLGVAVFPSLLALACSALHGDGLRRSVPPREPTTAQVPVPDADEPVASEALETDGDSRLLEPSRRHVRRAPDAEFHAQVMPLHERPHPRINSHAKGSISLGTVTAGQLVDGAEIEQQGKHHRLLDMAAPRNTRFTTDEMKKLLLCAAAEVAKAHPGQQLSIGNLSRKGGGLLPWSVSHQNGRDADLAFYARTPRGIAVKPDQLYRFNWKLESTDAPLPMRFDVAANWTLAKALATCPAGVEIQFLFVAEWLRQPMLAHARERKEDKDVIARVSALLHQPRKAMPHDDHLHVRIGCPKDDRGEGCVEVARAGPTAMGHAAGVQARLPEVRARYDHADLERRAEALQLGALYRDAKALPHLFAALGDADLALRTVAFEALAAWRPDGFSAAVRDRIACEIDGGLLARLLETLLKTGDEDALVALLRDPRVVTAPPLLAHVPEIVVRKLAVQLLAGTHSLQVAPAAVALIEDVRPDVRRAARRTLEGLLTRTARDVIAQARLAAQWRGGPVATLVGLGVTGGRDGDPGPDPDSVSAAEEAAAWRRALDALPSGTSREAVVIDQLQRLGLHVDGLHRAVLPELVRALSLPWPYAENAGRLIERVVAWRPSEGRGAYANPERFWPEWLAKRRLIAVDANAAANPDSGADAD
jgi:murein endopeptidase